MSKVVLEDTGSIIFNVPECAALIELKANGDIYVKGRLVENDKEVVEGFRDFLRAARNQEKT